MTVYDLIVELTDVLTKHPRAAEWLVTFTSTSTAGECTEHEVTSVRAIEDLHEVELT